MAYALNTILGTQYDDTIIIKLNSTSANSVTTAGGTLKGRKLAKATFDATGGLFDKAVFAGEGNDRVYGVDDTSDARSTAATAMT